jgi:hypothetical protein
MKRFLLLLAVVLPAMVLLPACVYGADLNSIKTVYLLPMFSGLDQYLAVRLTTGAIFQVVVDPRNADAVLTDHIGQSFEDRLDEIYGAKPKGDDDKNGSTPEFARPVSGAHSRGAIFLVNRKTRDVLWSTYEQPKGNAPSDLNRAADRIAEKLAKTIKGK